MPQGWTGWKTTAPAFILVMLVTSPCHAQTLTVALTANSVSFNLVQSSATNAGSTSITATTTCGGCFFRRVNVYAYFNNAATALTDGFGDNIPSSAFQISNNGGPFQALTNNTPFGGAGGGRQLSTFFVFFFNNTHNDTMNFNIDLNGLPNLAPGTYTGTLNIRAQSP